MCRKILSAAISTHEGVTQITPTAGINILWGENAEQIFGVLAGVLDICLKERLVQGSVRIQAEICWPCGTVYGISGEEHTGTQCMGVKYMKNPTVKNRRDLVKRFHKQRLHDAREKNCFFDGARMKRLPPLGESDLILDGFFAFIKSVSKQEMGRPLFLRNFLERLDEAVALQPIFDALRSTERQIFIVVPQYYKWRESLMTQPRAPIDLRDTEEYREYGFKIVKCPVCGKETLDDYFICPTCDWEYDGTTEENEYSSCNKATIADYRKNS